MQSLPSERRRWNIGRNWGNVFAEGVRDLSMTVIFPRSDLAFEAVGCLDVLNSRENDCIGYPLQSDYLQIWKSDERKGRRKGVDGMDASEGAKTKLFNKWRSLQQLKDF